MKRIGNILWILISAIAMITLAVTLIIAYIPPDSALNVLSGLNLLFPYALIFSLICITVCLFRRQFYTALCIGVILLLSIPNIGKSIGFASQKQAITESIKLSCYNVHYFNFYDYKQKNALEYLKTCDADILCLQEILVMRNQPNNLQHLLKSLSKYSYHHIVFFYEGNRLRKGIATLSKYPIVKKQRADINSQSHGAISSWIRIGNDTLQVINCYLESNRLTSAEKEIYKSQEKTNIIKRIYNKLASASQKRGCQAKVVSALKDPHCATLVCGDLNDVATSYVYRTIAQDDTDTFLALNHGIGTTFHEGIYRFRIDYIFADSLITPLSFRINKQPYSDHHPIELQCKFK